jgi:preprotein translocase subunit YajC
MSDFLWYNLLSFLIIVFIFFILVFLPTYREKRKKNQMLSSLKRGDKVILQSGMLAKISEIKGDIIIVELAPKIRVEVLKSAVIAKR